MATEFHNRKDCGDPRFPISLCVGGSPRGRSQAGAPGVEAEGERGRGRVEIRHLGRGAEPQGTGVGRLCVGGPGTGHGEGLRAAGLSARAARPVCWLGGAAGWQGPSWIQKTWVGAEAARLLCVPVPSGSVWLSGLAGLLDSRMGERVGTAQVHGRVPGPPGPRRVLPAG